MTNITSTNDSSPLRTLLSNCDEGRKRRFHYYCKLRTARAQVLADAEGFEHVVFEIERLGKFLHPTGTGLGQYKPKLRELVAKQLDEDQAERFEARIFLLTQSRNDHMHEGAHARHASLEAVDAALLLEEALMSISWKDLKLRDVMVSGVIAAEPWYTLGEVRHLMLRHGFTCIPVNHGGKWYLLRDWWLAAKVGAEGKKKRQEVYATKVAEVLPPKCLGLESVETKGDTELLHQLCLGKVLEEGLVLVHDSRHSDQPLIGVIAAADLM